MKEYDQLKSKVEAGIDAVLIGASEKFEAKGVPPAMVVEYLETLDGYEKTDIETNGWQYDWWINLTKGEKTFTAFGCGYEGMFEIELDKA